MSIGGFIMVLRFFNSFLERSEVEWKTMPLKIKDQIALGVWMCQQDGLVPGHFLQMGMMILRRLDREKLSTGETSSFWPFVGLLEWIACCSPSEQTVRLILEDLDQMYPRSLQATMLVYDRIGAKFPHLASPIENIKFLRLWSW